MVLPVMSAETRAIPEDACHDHFIPLQRRDLIDLLCTDKDLLPADRDNFRRFSALVGSIIRLEYNRHLEKLKATYAPFDPDADAKLLTPLGPPERLQKLNELFGEFAWLMDRANFRHLSRDELEPALAGASEWGILMDVDFRAFERLAIFARGDSMEKRTKRRWRRLGRKVDVELPIYQRLVMILKLKPNRRLGRHVDTENVFIQIFKNIPRLDVSMLLPGARVRLTHLDKGKIGLPLIGGIFLVILHIIQDIVGSIAHFLSQLVLFEPAALWAAITGTIGYGIRSYFGWVQTKQRYNFWLTKILYFQNLDTNAGVLFRVLDEAEEQEYREAVLAYYFLWHHGGDKGWPFEQLEQGVQAWVEARTHVPVEFQARDALARLQKLGVVQKIQDHFCARNPAEAVVALRSVWDLNLKKCAAEPLFPPATAPSF